jgi:VWFA-related protein
MMSVKKATLLTLVFTFILFFICPLTLSQKLGANYAHQEKQEIPKPTYAVEVIVTNADVFVTDKTGRRVTGLRPENFQIYEDGLRQTLTNFYEVKGREVYSSSLDKEKEQHLQRPELLARKPAQTQNKIILYFDNWHLHPMNRNWSIKKLEFFIKNNFSAEIMNNLGMVVSLDQKLEILQDFTSSQGELLRALDKIKGRSSQSLMRQKDREDLRKELNRMITESTGLNKYDNYERAIGLARNYVEADQNDLFYSIKSLNAFVDYLLGIEGKKILIYVSDGLPLNPGEEAFGAIDWAFPQGNARSESMNYDATRSFKELTTRANSNEIALYPINAQGLESLILSADQERGWETYSRGSGMTKPGSRATNEALKLMANDTGGLAILNTNDINSGLEKIENDLQFYYSLGYVSPDREDSKYHSIEVKIVGVNEDYDFRVRHGYLRVSQEEKIKESVFSRLFLKRNYNPMEIMAQMMPLEKIPGSENLRLTIKFLIPIKKITLLPRQDDYFGQIKVYIALVDQNGLVSPSYELSEEIKIPKKDYAVALSSSYPYYSEMNVRPSYYTFSLAVKDVLGETVNYLQFEREIHLD